MSLRVKILITIGSIISAFVIYKSIEWYTANNIDIKFRSDKPFAIRFILMDEEKDHSLEILMQCIFFPAHKQLGLYFINTDAYYPDEEYPVREMSPVPADRFRLFTGLRSEYYIYINKEDAIRFIDILGGANLFFEKPIFFEDATFQYPQGIAHIPGAQALEFVLGRLIGKDKKKIPLSIDRLFRQESLLLNLLWGLKRYRREINHEDMSRALYSLVNTNMNFEELGSVIEFFASGFYSGVLEIPMGKVSGKKSSKSIKLIVKEQSARNLFDNFRDNLVSGALRRSSFMVEVLNGTDRKRLARRVKYFLQDKGPLVLEVANYRYKPLPETIILERIGNSYAADLMARITGTKRTRVFFRRRALQVQMTFIIGADFKIKNLKL